MDRDNISIDKIETGVPFPYHNNNNNIDDTFIEELYNLISLNTNDDYFNARMLLFKVLNHYSTADWHLFIKRIDLQKIYPLRFDLVLYYKCNDLYYLVDELYPDLHINIFGYRYDL